MSYTDSGDYVIDPDRRVVFRQVGWRGHKAGGLYPMGASTGRDIEPGGFSPVYVEIENDPRPTDDDEESR